MVERQELLELKVGIVGTFRRLDKQARPVRDPGCESHIVSAMGVLVVRFRSNRTAA